MNNSGKSEPTGKKILQLLAPSAKRVQNGAEKTHFASFLLPKERIVLPTNLPRRFPWDLNSKRESIRSWKLSEHNFEFFQRGHFPRKPHFKGFRGYTCGARAPALTFMSTANLSIAPYNRMTRDVCTPVTFWQLGRCDGGVTPMVTSDDP